MPAAVPDLIDIKKLASRLGDSVRHIRRLVATKRIPYLKVGQLVRFDPDEITASLDAQRVAVSGTQVEASEGAGDGRVVARTKAPLGASRHSSDRPIEDSNGQLW